MVRVTLAQHTDCRFWLSARGFIQAFKAKGVAESALAGNATASLASSAHAAPTRARPASVRRSTRWSALETFIARRKNSYKHPWHRLRISASSIFVQRNLASLEIPYQFQLQGLEHVGQPQSRHASRSDSPAPAILCRKHPHLPSCGVHGPSRHRRVRSP